MGRNNYQVPRMTMLILAVIGIGVVLVCFSRWHSAPSVSYTAQNGEFAPSLSFQPIPGLTNALEGWTFMEAFPTKNDDFHLVDRLIAFGARPVKDGEATDILIYDGGERISLVYRRHQVSIDPVDLSATSHLSKTVAEMASVRNAELAARLANQLGEKR